MRRKAGEVSHWVKCLLYGHEDLSSDPHHLQKASHSDLHLQPQHWVGTGTGGSQELNVKLQVQWQTLSNYREKRRKTTYVDVFPSYEHHTHISTHISMNTHISTLTHTHISTHISIHITDRSVHTHQHTYQHTQIGTHIHWRWWDERGRQRERQRQKRKPRKAEKGGLLPKSLRQFPNCIYYFFFLLCDQKAGKSNLEEGRTYLVQSLRVQCSIAGKWQQQKIEVAATLCL